MSSDTSVPNAGAPIRPHTPVGAVHSTAWRKTTGEAVVSRLKSAPLPVMARSARPHPRARVDHMGRAELAREREPRGFHVDADDRRAARDRPRPSRPRGRPFRFRRPRCCCRRAPRARSAPLRHPSGCRSRRARRRRARWRRAGARRCALRRARAWRSSTARRSARGSARRRARARWCHRPARRRSCARRRMAVRGPGALAGRAVTARVEAHADAVAGREAETAGRRARPSRPPHDRARRAAARGTTGRERSDRCGRCPQPRPVRARRWDEARPARAPAARTARPWTR